MATEKERLKILSSAEFALKGALRDALRDALPGKFPLPRPALKLLEMLHIASAVHFVRFEFNTVQREALRAGATVKIDCGHANYPAPASVAAETLASLAGDLR